MGARGPQPTPTAVLDQRGSWRAATRKNEPTDDVSAPPRPEWLQGEAAAEWDRVVPLMLGRRTLGQLDLAVLSVYCQAWAAFIQAANEGDARGVDDSAARLLKAADRLGLSPAAKSRIQTYGTGDNEKPAGLTRFRLAGGESQVA